MRYIYGIANIQNRCAVAIDLPGIVFAVVRWY